MRQINDLTISPKPPSSNMKPNIDILDSVIEQCIESTLNLKVVILMMMITNSLNDTSSLPKHSFYLQVGNPYLDDDVDNHTEKLLSRYEALVDRVMASNDMNQVYVLPQLHTLLWSNKKVFNNYFINEKYF